MSFAATGKDPEIIILSEVFKKNYHITYMWNFFKKMTHINIFAKQKQIHRLKRQTYGFQGGNVEGEQ